MPLARQGVLGEDRHSDLHRGPEGGVERRFEDQDAPLACARDEVHPVDRGGHDGSVAVAHRSDRAGLVDEGKHTPPENISVVVRILGHHDLGHDDLGIGAYNAIRIAGKQIPVVSNDGVKQAFELINSSFYLGTVNAFSHWIGGYALVRLFDALHGWKPAPSERMMFWQTSWTDKTSATKYLKAFWSGKNPYNYTKMSRVLFPTGWDTQQQLRPMDPNYIWGGEKKPASYKLPAGYDKKSLAKTNALYQAHWKTRTFK